MIKATVLLLLGWCLIPRFRTLSAAERHFLWVATLFGAAILPILSVLLPSGEPGWAGAVLSALPASFGGREVWTPGSAVDIVVHAQRIESTPIALEHLVHTIWGFGALITIAFFARDCGKLVRLARSV